MEKPQTAIVTTEHEAAITIMKPALVLAQAQEAAKALIEVVSKKPKPVIMNNEQYLEYEDWQTVGQFYRYAVKTGEAVPVEINGVQGAKARAELINMDTGQILGGAEAYCMRDEEKWNTRPKYEWQDDDESGERKRIKVGDEIVPWFQLASMAQTRAGAKAYRNRLAWVVVLAGYRPTPAEELTDSTIQRGEETHQKAHWCAEHKAKFFKKGKMTGYAHPVEGTNPVVWCSEQLEATKKPVEAPPQDKSVIPPSTASATAPVAPGEGKQIARPEAIPSSPTGPPFDKPGVVSQPLPATETMPKADNLFALAGYIATRYKIMLPEVTKKAGKEGLELFESHKDYWDTAMAIKREREAKQ